MKNNEAFADAACTQNLATGFAAGVAERPRIVSQHSDDLTGFATATDVIADFEHWHGAARRGGRRLGHANLLDGAIEDGLLFAAQEQRRGGVFGYLRSFGQRRNRRAFFGQVLIATAQQDWSSKHVTRWDGVPPSQL